jgi:hypothetical protein
MAIRPAKNWNVPAIIIMMAAKTMSPVAQPLVARLLLPAAWYRDAA